MRSAMATSCLKLTLKSLFHSLKLSLNPPLCQLEHRRKSMWEVSNCFSSRRASSRPVQGCAARRRRCGIKRGMSWGRPQVLRG